jgi:hypothetical protein
MRAAQARVRSALSADQKLVLKGPRVTKTDQF